VIPLFKLHKGNGALAGEAKGNDVKSMAEWNPSSITFSATGSGQPTRGEA